MRTTTLRILLIALAAVLALTMIGCKGESSPTAPPSTSTTPSGPGVAPPTGATIALAVSNATPLVSSKVTITATVTANGQNVPDGTAVQFTTTLGTFADTGTNTTIRTTTAGVATATLSATSPGAATVTATVNNVSKTTTVTFSNAPVVPPPPNTAPTITSVCVITGSTCTTPATGIPAGGQQVVINGTNFRAPVRVLFDPGNGQPAKEAFVNSVTATQITVIAPAFDIATGQTLPVTITVIDEAGTANEQKVSAQNAFTYQLAVLTPVVRTLSPTSGPIDGGTQVAILGDAFQAPVQVFFGAAEAQVLKVTFNEIDVVSPTARDTAPNGSGIVTGPVDVKVRNVGSGKETTFPAAFRYLAKMQITGVSPLFGSVFGGTDITIDGVGFTDPVSVTIGGFQAQVLRVSGTQILARTLPTGAPCASGGGPITVTNINNGDFFSTATMGVPLAFTFVAVQPLITSVSPTTVNLGNTVNVTVQDPGIGPLGSAVITFKVNDTTVVSTPLQITNGTGAQPFSVVVPSNLTFPTVTCQTTTLSGLPINGTQFGPILANLTFTNATTTCTTTRQNAFTITPPTPNPCVTPPVALVTSPVPPNCANAGSVTVGGSSTTSITIKNDAPAAGQTLQISSATVGGTNATEFTVGPPPPQMITQGNSTTYTVTFTPTATGPRTATITFGTNDPAHPTVVVCVNGTGM